MVNNAKIVNQLNAFTNMFKFKSTWAFKKLITSPSKKIGLFTGNQFGKCMFFKEKLLTDSGLVEAGKLKGPSLGGETLANTVFEDEVYEVTFQTGIKIKCNLEHPFWWKPYKTKREGEWRSLKDIREHKISTHGSKYGYVYFADASEYNLVEEDIKVPKLLGYLCSDGYINTPGQSIKFTNKNLAFISEVENLAMMNFKDLTCNLKPKDKCYDLFLIREDRQPNSLRQYIDSLNISSDSFGKILAGKKSDLKEFVKGFFNGDGYLLIRRRKKGWGRLPHIEVGFCVGPSENKAYELQYILWKLGIFSYICAEEFKKAKNTFYRVKVNSFDVPRILGFLEDTKYPEKFKEARDILKNNPNKRNENRNWVSIKSIKYVGREKVAGITTSSGELISYCGMKTHNTCSVAYQYVLRILGLHPVPEKNVVYFECVNGHTFQPLVAMKLEKCDKCGEPLTLHERTSRVFRFASQTLPGQSKNVSESGESAEIKNTQYPEFKKWLPQMLIKSDITIRNTSMIIKDIFNGPDIIVEFVSYNQTVQGTAGVQRCVAKDQRVLKSNGVWTKIQDIKPGDELICEALGGYGKRQRVNKVKKAGLTGIKDVYRFNCQKGISFEVTLDHPIMIPGKGYAKYKLAGDLKVGDYVTCKLSDIEGEDTLEDWKVALLGLYLGDGSSASKKYVKITNGNRKLIKSLESILPDYLYLRKVEVDIHVPDYYISSKTSRKNEIKDFLVSSGLWGKTACDKFVPDEIFKQSRSKISLFLRYLFAADGWASGHTIGYCSTSERLCQDVFLLLRRLGIRSSITKKTFCNGWNTQWWVTINASRDVLTFIDKVGIEGKDLDKVKDEATRRFNVRNKKSLGSNNLPQKVKIKSIEYVGKKEVYDIMMETGGWDERVKNGIKKQRGVARSPRNNFLIQGGVVVHNCSIWLDEEAPYDFYEEQLPRLIAENGDMLFTLTPASYISWMHDYIFDKARVYYRTEAVCNFLKKYENKDVKRVEVTDNPYDIVVIQAATDDNPTLSKEAIESQFETIDDPDVLAIRRYGIFKQVSGRIYKDFEAVHVIDADKYFPNGLPSDYLFARGIDYHPQTPWAIGMIALSPTNEAFIFGDLEMSPEKYTVAEIMYEIARLGGDYKFKFNKIDPLAEANKKDGVTVLEDINRIFYEYSREGLCYGAFWSTWDTKGERGRDEIRKRLKNSKRCGRPFNNRVVVDGKEEYLPTIWIFSNCRHAIKSMKLWRWEEWSDSKSVVTKDKKNKPEQKWSHMNMVWEAIFKERGFIPPKVRNPFDLNRYRSKKLGYFKGRR